MIDFTDGGARLQVVVLADAGRLTLTLTGELDGISGPPLTDVLHTAMHDGIGHVDVDIAQVGFVDLHGLRALLRAYQLCASRGSTLMLRDPQPHVVRLLRFTDTAASLLAEGAASADAAACPPAGGRCETPDERDQRAREREEEADDRERLMQARNQLLDERQLQVSEHQRWEDIREDLADIRERHLERREYEH